ncbi:MAG: glycosyltransferase family 2 protein [Prolixibacteraceae bacterium]|nr:glycosyltransferase family 2 protein [Prolixibacteraceae bacterium]
MIISVVIPVLNESSLISKLLDETFQQLNETGENFEVVCIDDGSTDTTLSELIDFREKNKKLKIISLSRNFGLQAALTAGLEYANGNIVVIMDGDFQDPPELIPVLYKKMKETNADIVTAVREQRNEKLSRRIYTNIFHRIFSNVSEGVQIANAGNFCMLNKKAHNAILRFAERNRYIPGIRNFIGFKQEFVLFNRPERLEGKAKMSRKKLFSMAADAIYSFSKWPIKACLFFGVLGVIIFLAAIIYTLVSKLMNFAPLGWSSMFLAVSFFGSVQLTFMGLIGEYIYRIFKEVQNRPVYFIKEIYE